EGKPRRSIVDKGALYLKYKLSAATSARYGFVASADSQNHPLCTLSPARDIQNRARHIRRRIAQQPDDRLRDLIRRARSSQRRWGPHPLRPPGLAAAGVDVGLDHARPDRIDAHAIAPELLAKADRQRIDGAFRARVVAIEIRQ